MKKRFPALVLGGILADADRKKLHHRFQQQHRNRPLQSTVPTRNWFL